MVIYDTKLFFGRYVCPQSCNIGQNPDLAEKWMFAHSAVGRSLGFPKILFPLLKAHPLGFPTSQRTLKNSVSFIVKIAFVSFSGKMKFWAYLWKHAQFFLWVAKYHRVLTYGDKKDCWAFHFRTRSLYSILPLKWGLFWAEIRSAQLSCPGKN